MYRGKINLYMCRNKIIQNIEKTKYMIASNIWMNNENSGIYKYFSSHIKLIVVVV